MFTDIVVSLLNPQNVGERVHIHLGGGGKGAQACFISNFDQQEGHLFEGALL